MTPPTFSLTRNGTPLHSVAIGDALNRGQELCDVSELQAYGFSVNSREADEEYNIWIGDIEASVAGQPSLASVAGVTGIALGHQMLWPDAHYFEGARGLAWIKLASRHCGSKGGWRERALLPVVVASTKMSDARYNAMYEQLRGLASGLVLDLVSKTFRSMDLGVPPSRIAVRSSLIELRLLEKLWPPIADSLRAIARDPVRRLHVRQRLQSCWGSERFGPRSVNRMVAMGVDPRRSLQAVPFEAVVEKIAETNDTVEHRVIRGFLELLERQIEECRANVLRQVSAIERDRPWRHRAPRGGMTLYESEDLPRLRRLHERLARADQLREQFHRASQLAPFRNVQPHFGLLSTPVFRNVDAYRRLQHEMVRYLRTGLVIVDEGFEERVKSTSRLYEQWVFLQLAAAFRFLGLRCISRQGLLHTTRMFRFTLDIDRGARLTFGSSDGRTISVRYEPWIVPRDVARQTLDTLYRGRSGESAWSPDILIEILSGTETVGQAASVDYAIVVDAKYASAIHDYHWEDTDKYLEVRSTKTDRQVVRQLWLAHPSENTSEITLRDPALVWSANGPNCPRDEVVQGVLNLLPTVQMEEEEDGGGWLQHPESGAVNFVRGLLTYLGFQENSSSG